jgi:hypothetical protein
MANIFLSAEQQGIVVFWVWTSLGYWRRMLLSWTCILAGFFLQYQWHDNWYTIGAGFGLIFVGNLFLLVSGYDNRVNFTKYSPSAAWERVEQSKLAEIKELVKKMKRWDRSALDASNWLGKLIFIVFLIIIVIVLIGALVSGNLPLLILSVDAFLLLFPHWVTGTRDILTQPNLLSKIKIIERLEQKVAPDLREHQLEPLLLLQGAENKFPSDVKFRVNIQNHHPDFLGLYGQIVLNSVNGSSYPYFYVVVVAKKGYGLKNAFNHYAPSGNITKEYKGEGDVEVIVIRQTTSSTSGYHTNDGAIQRIFLEGLKLAEEVAVK